MFKKKKSSSQNLDLECLFNEKIVCESAEISCFQGTNFQGENEKCEENNSFMPEMGVNVLRAPMVFGIVRGEGVGDGAGIEFCVLVGEEDVIRSGRLFDAI